MKLYDNHPLWDSLEEDMKDSIIDTTKALTKNKPFAETAYIDYTELILEKYCELTNCTEFSNSPMLLSFIFFFIWKFIKTFDVINNQYPSDYLIELLNDKNLHVECVAQTLKMLAMCKIKNDIKDLFNNESTE